MQRIQNFIIMKSGYVGRKVILEAIRHQQPKAQSHKQVKEKRNIETPSRFPPNRLIIRNFKKTELQHNKAAPNHRQTKRQVQSQSQNVLQNEPIESHQQTQEQAKAPEQFLQARDRRTQKNYDFRERKFELQKQRDKLNEWLGQMHFKVVSASFNLYLTNQLTFEQVKVHCCENLLLNILNFFDNLTHKNQQRGLKSLASSLLKKQKIKMIPLSYLELTQILKQMNQTLVKNLAYMQIKYPLTKDTKPNKALQTLISKINNLGNDEHDMAMKSGVDFKLKKEDNYTPQIMKLLNFIITKQSQPCEIKGRNNKELTYFQYFYQTIQSIFTSVYKPDYDDKEKSKQQQEHPRAQEQAVGLFANIFSAKAIAQENQAEFMTKQGKQYKQKVMKYTHYLIGRKISSNTQLYSQKQILTQIFDVRNSSILRILTKWTQQLEDKIINAQQTILKRPFRFKKNKPYQYSKLSANQKNDLYQQTKRRAKDVKLFNEQLQQNYNQIQSMLCSHLEQTEGMKNIPKNEYKVGYFCSKAQVAASSTLLSYLNKMIHILLLIPEQLKKNHFHDEQYIQSMDINLITFKIADLFRCKLKSREAEIVRIFKQIKKISQIGEPFKIVRIKDRLNLGTRDILINILFKNIFLCEIQLAVEEYVDAKQLSYDSFSHFLYELHRSRLGPIMQSACTWAQFDQRSKIFRHLEIEKSFQQRKEVNHNCEKQFLVSNKYPFVCSSCQKFYSTQQGLLNHVKCNLCRTYFQCSVCIYSKMQPLQIAKLIQLPQKIGVFFNEFQVWSYTQGVTTSFPKFGLLTSKKMKKPDIVFFQTIIYKFDCYVLRIVQDKSQNEYWNIEIIEKIEGNTLKGWHKVSQKYIIYDWKEKRSINNTITPDIMLKAMEQQKRNRQLAAKAKKDEKERKRQQLQKRRNQKQNAQSDEDGDDQGKKKDNKKRKQSQSDNQSHASKAVKKDEQQQFQQMSIKYHENICKKNEYLKVRVTEKTSETTKDILVLGIYLKQSVIRNKLKQMSNKNILQKIRVKKIEVLFFQDQHIRDQLNNVEYLSELQKVELKQTVERVSQVYLDNNFIQDIEFLSNMVSLKVAHLSNNNISQLNPLLNLKCLTELVLQNNKIYSLQGLKNKPNIVQLNLNRNQLQVLNFFTQCQEGEYNHLRNLYVNGNEICSMQGLQKLINLRKLDLSYNKIQEVMEIKTLTNLQQLDLSKNKLTKLKNIQCFQNLKKLYLSENKIKNIPAKITQLVFLNVLQMSGNKIKKIKNINTGALSKSLKILNLSDNLIQKMEGLDGLQFLQILNLSNNFIQTIDNYLDLTSLVKLDLSHNALQDIDLQDTQKYLPYLKQLYLNSNPINNSQSNKRVLVSLMKHIGIVKIVFKSQNVF